MRNLMKNVGNFILLVIFIIGMILVTYALYDVMDMLDLGVDGS